MKFLCDRCKTRYSIGDERVRGKILKIRCKNCANVVTVREGMTADADAAQPTAPEYARRAKKPTTMAPMALSEGSEPVRGANAPAREVRGSVGAAGAVQARRTAPSSEAGRGQASAGRPSAVLRSGPGAPVHALSALGQAFASAMENPPPALEEEWYVSIAGEQAGPFSLAEAQRWIAQKAAGVELHCWSEGFDDWLPVDKVSHFRELRKRPAGAAAPRPTLRGESVLERAVPDARVPVGMPVEEDPRPLFAATMASLERSAPIASNPGLSLRSPATSAVRVPSLGTAMPSRPRPAETPPNGAGSPSGPAGNTGAADPFVASDAGDAGAASTAEAPGSGTDGGDDLAIGEVSRVVKLADISGAPRDPARPAFARQARAGSVAGGRQTGAGPIMRSTASHASASPGIAQDGAPAGSVAGDSGRTMAPFTRAHRRGLIALISVAGVMVLGVVGAVVLLVTTDDDPISSNLRQVHNIDTSRPEDPISHRPIEPVGSARPAPPDPLVPRPPPRLPRPNPNLAGSNHDPAPTLINSLRSDEIEDVARKHQDMTQRCYLRSQRGADAILIGDVKKIAVTLVIDKDGTVSQVQLSDHAADNLGKCLSSSIRSWKFRQSSGGTFRLSLNFVSG